jgi:hypothetical protein
MSPKETELWSNMWNLRNVFRVPAMKYGRCRKRLDRLISNEKRIINLLPPSDVSGKWDAELARCMACELVTWIEKKQDSYEYSGVVFLGRRLANIFMNRSKFGDVREVAGVPALSLPHPSGCNRFWNKPNAEKTVREEWVAPFIRRIV